MLSVFNTTPVQLGPNAVPVNPMVTRAATAAAETINEIIWIIQVDC